jgi:uridine kinase
MKELVPTEGQPDLMAKLCADIREHNSKIPLLINISGCTGAGKSTWAEYISDEFRSLGVSVIHISEDDFLQPREYREGLRSRVYDSGEWEGKTYWENHDNWLRLDLMKEVITDLSEGKSSTYHPYQRETGKFSLEQKTVQPADVVVFETSIFSELFDVVVLIDVDDNILLERKLHRDSDLRDEETIRAYHKVQLDFWNKHKPSNPNYVIDNKDYARPKLYIDKS